MRKRLYYVVSNPTLKNIHTGNVCVSITELLKFDKDFLFDQMIGDKRYTIVLTKEWVRDNATFVRKKADTLKNTYKCFYLLSIKDIINYGQYQFAV